jgi:hypothetical protein
LPSTTAVHAPQLPAVAHALEAGVVEPITQRVEQRDAGLDLQRVRLAVHGERDLHRARTDRRRTAARALRRGRLAGDARDGAGHAHCLEEGAAGGVHQLVAGLSGCTVVFVLRSHQDPQR